MLIRLSK